MKTIRLVGMLLGLVTVAATAYADAPDVDLTVGGDVRMRGYALENMWDADSDADGDRWSLMRHRTRVFVKAGLERGVTGYIRLANQHWGEGVTAAEERGEVDNLSNKLFVDAAYVNVERLFDAPVELRIGRQALIYGDGFVLFDGQSQTASTSIYLDGVRARLGLAEGVDLDLLHFKDEERVRADAAEDDLSLGGAYLTRKGARGDSQDLYLLRRCDQATDKEVLVYGLRAAGRTIAGLDYACEGVLQRGDHDADTEHEAWGMKAGLGWTPSGAPFSPRFFLGYVGLSGDDPSTETHERWDVVHGGWPQFGDILAWTYLNLGAGNAMSAFDPGYGDGSTVMGEVVYGNLSMPIASVELQPVRDTRLGASFSRLRAEHAVGSDEIGDCWQMWLKHRYSKQLSFAFYGAILDPGAAYGPDADPIHEFFWETNLSF